jgi:hypothetical protein
MVVFDLVGHLELFLDGEKIVVSVGRGTRRRWGTDEEPENAQGARVV